VIIFSYTSSPEVKISQKVLGGLLYFDSHCILRMADIVFHVAGMVVEHVDDVVCGHWPIWMSFVC